MKIMKFEEFGEFRKGSNEYGTLVNDLMMWLRIYKKDTTKTIKVTLTKFLKDTKIKQDDFIKFINDPNLKNLITFDIELNNNKLKFYNLDKSVSVNKKSVYEK